MADERVEEFGAADTAYDVAMRRLDEQMRQIDAVDNKASTAIAASSAVAALFAGFASVTIVADEVASLIVGTLAIALVMVIYSRALTYGLRSLQSAEWDLRPNWSDLIDYAKIADERLLRSWVADSCVASLTENRGRISDKLQNLSRALVFIEWQVLAAGAGFLAILFANGATD